MKLAFSLALMLSLFSIELAAKSVSYDYYNPNLNTVESCTVNPNLKSFLNNSVTLEEFGQIAYRKPLPENFGPTVVLFHGIFGGVSHRSYKELLKNLDNMGYRVFIMDLPGVGASYKPRKKYSIKTIDKFIYSFLSNVVSEPSHVVAASTITTSALYVAGKHPDLFSSLTVLAPVGVTGLKKSPGIFQKIFTNYKNRYKKGSVKPYIDLLTPENIRFYSSFAYYNLDLVNDELIEESQLQQYNLDQRWITYAFVSGLIYRSFEDATKNLDTFLVPTQALVGQNVKSFRPNKFLPTFQKPETVEEFRKINDEIKYEVIPESAGAIWREKPKVVARLLQKFIDEN